MAFPTSTAAITTSSSSALVNAGTTFKLWVRLSTEMEGEEVPILVIGDGTETPTVYDLRQAVKKYFEVVRNKEITNADNMPMTWDNKRLNNPTTLDQVPKKPAIVITPTFSEDGSPNAAMKRPRAKSGEHKGDDEETQIAKCRKLADEKTKEADRLADEKARLEKELEAVQKEKLAFEKENYQVKGENLAVKKELQTLKEDLAHTNSKSSHSKKTTTTKSATVTTAPPTAAPAVTFTKITTTTVTAATLSSSMKKNNSTHRRRSASVPSMTFNIPQKLPSWPDDESGVVSGASGYSSGDYSRDNLIVAVNALAADKKKKEENEKNKKEDPPSDDIEDDEEEQKEEE